MARRDLKDGRALVTGASSGIGQAMATELARGGVDLVLVARRADRLEQVVSQLACYGRAVLPVVGDITTPAVRQRALDVARDQLGGLDLLVNNAGISAHGRFVDATADRLRQIMEVNFFAAAELMREALPLLQQGRQPMVVNVGSILGHRGLPFTTDYCASKFALHGFSEAVRPELKRLGIDMLVVAPATTRTELNDRLIEKTDERPWKEPRGVSADHVARAAVRAIRRGQREIVPSWSGWWLVALNRWFPSIVDRIADRYG
ncbi:MAG: SDR family NAD(P)-dependent oxidoreductase [Mariniblastus sp.]|nr:SDR family NAD(P)-dependent oxidoreductase [Mariniblastus sp.]